jgi:hypothetical protein
MTDEPPRPDEPPGVGIDRHRADEAMYQPFNPGPLPFVRGEDGLPTPETPTSLPLVPPLVPETMVCIADRSSFVVRDEWGAIKKRYSPERVERAPDGRYFVRVLYFWRRVVEPIRPQCKFLVRQMVDFQDAAENQFLERLCTARRDSESFFLSVRDQQVHACEFRSPRDERSEVRLDRFDDAKMKQGAERYEVGGVFDVDAALARTEAEADRGLAYGGIFKETK